MDNVDQIYRASGLADQQHRIRYAHAVASQDLAKVRAVAAKFSS